MTADAAARRLAPALLLAVASGIVITAIAFALYAVPFTRVEYSRPAVHVVIGTAVGVVSGCVAYLVYGRYQLRGQASDLVLSISFAIAAAADLVSVAVQAHFGGPTPFSIWSSATARTLAAGVLCLGAFSRRRLPLRVTSGPAVAALALAVVAVVAALTVGFASSLPDAAPAFGPTSPERDLVASTPPILVLQALRAVLFTVAAVGFHRRWRAEQDDLAAYLAAFAALMAFARVNFALFPSTLSEYVFTGDVLVVIAVLVLLAGAAREIRRYWSQLALEAVFDERRRLAREFHDGVAQELVLLRQHARAVESLDEAVGRQVLTSVERALDETRAAVAALAAAENEGVHEAIERAAEDLAHRLGVRAVLKVTPVEIDVSRREALVRIVREAITNAVRHGGAERVEIELDPGPPVTVRITDNGRGFDTENASGGFGLRSMRERADAVGGTLSVWSEPGKGAVVEVRFA